MASCQNLSLLPAPAVIKRRERVGYARLPPPPSPPISKGKVSVTKMDAFKIEAANKEEEMKALLKEKEEELAKAMYEIKELAASPVRISIPRFRKGCLLVVSGV